MQRKYLKVGSFIVLAILCLVGIMNSAVALLSGFLFTLIFGQYFGKQKAIIINYLLKVSIIGLGFGMYIEETLKIGQEGLSLTVFTIALTLVLGFFITKLLKIDSKLGYLISSGTSICGGSAIAAVSSVIKSSPETISLALGVVFFLNAIALFIFPPLGHLFNLNQHQFGLWSAVAIHDTSSVVGAALQYGDQALKEATTVKLARSLWIIPVSLLSMIFFKNKGGNIKIPWFILLFVVAILINSYLKIPPALSMGITHFSQKMLVLTLFLIGSSISVNDIKTTGAKPFVLGVSLWICISVVALLYILYIL